MNLARALTVRPHTNGSANRRSGVVGSSADSRIVAVAILATLVLTLAVLAVFTRLGIYVPIIAIGIAFALQKYVASYFGFFIIRFSDIFNIGDRIRIGNIKGVVKQVSLLHVILEEVGEDEKLGGELTGRILHIPNLVVLDQPVLNYSKNYSVGDKLLSCDYIFDEVRIPLTVKSDIAKAEKLLEEILISMDHRFIEEAKEAFREDYPDFLVEAEDGPRILIHVEPHWVWLKGKFVTPVGIKNQLKSEVLCEFIKKVRETSDIELA